MNAKERVLGLLSGRQADRVACFSGTGTVWGQALAEYGCKFADVHVSSESMAKIALYPALAFDYECAVVPFDVCVEAELLGCAINRFANADRPVYPNLCRRIIGSEADMESFRPPAGLAGLGRVPLVTEAVGRLKASAGDRVAVGSYVLGPYTLAGQIMDINSLMRFTMRRPDKLNDLLARLTGTIAGIGGLYQAAGADYLCVREMGATADILPPALFARLVKPHLRVIMESLKVPTILHICGNSLPVLHLMLDCGAGAISVENRFKLGETRLQAGPVPLLFGNLDGYGTLVTGSPDDVAEEVKACLTKGSDGLWPACEISLDAPARNLRAMIQTVQVHGAGMWRRKMNAEF